MKTHPFVDRLALETTDTLSPLQVASVLGRDLKYARKLLQRNRIAHIKESVGVNSTPDHEGKQFRREVTHAAMLLYLISITAGDKTDILEAIKIRFPQHHDLCCRAAAGQAAEAPLPTGVVDARDAFSKPAGRRKAAVTCPPALRPGDFYQADLFDSKAHLPAHPLLLNKAK